MLKNLRYLTIASILLTGAIQAAEPQTTDTTSTQAFVQAQEDYKKADFQAAFKELLPLAEKGNAKAQYAIGYLYYYGKGVTRNSKLAEDWISKSASQHYTQAEQALAMMKKVAQTSTTPATTNTLANASPSTIQNTTVTQTSNAIAQSPQTNATTTTTQTEAPQTQNATVAQTTITTTAQSPQTNTTTTTTQTEAPQTQNATVAQTTSTTTAHSPQTNTVITTTTQTEIPQAKENSPVAEVKTETVQSSNTVASQALAEQTVPSTEKPTIPAQTNTNLNQSQATPSAQTEVSAKAPPAAPTTYSVTASIPSTQTAPMPSAQSQTAAAVENNHQAPADQSLGSEQTLIKEEIPAAEITKKTNTGEAKKTMPKASLSKDISKLPAKHYTIQLFASPHEKEVTRYVQKHSLSNSPVYLAKLQKEEEIRYVLSYGNYASQKEAKKALNHLNSKLRQHGAWIKTFGSLQNELSK